MPSRIKKKFLQLIDLRSYEAFRKIYGSDSADKKILFLVDDIGPTFLLAFLKPMGHFFEKKILRLDVYTTTDMLRMKSFHLRKMLHQNYSHIIFSRYSGPFYSEIINWARAENIPTTFFLDDNYFEFPEDFPPKTRNHHLSPKIFNCRKFLLENCDLVYCSTHELAELLTRKFNLSNVSYGIYTHYSSILPKKEPTMTIGYQGSVSHQRDLKETLPQISQFLQQHPDWKFELFGEFENIEWPPQIRNQIHLHPAIRNYDSFRDYLAALPWQIGLAPLKKDSFNNCKAPTKLIEYTSSGIPTLATKFGPYSAAIEAGAALELPATAAELEKIAKDSSLLEKTLARAHEYCENNFSLEKKRHELDRHLKITSSYT